MKRWLSLLLIAALLAAFSACSRQEGKEPDAPTENRTQSDGVLKLAYAKTDSLDPYTCTTQANLQILTLVYDGLFAMDAAYQPQPVLAESASVSGTMINVSLAQAVFSDGSAMTANDVVAAFNSAKNSLSFADRLQNFAQAAVAADNMVAFTLRSADPYAVSCLDFPIAKLVGGQMLGTGRYRMETTGETTYLVLNTNRAGFSSAIKTIQLVPVRDTNTLGSSLEIGNTAFYYDDLSSGVYTRLNAQMRDLGLNHLIYLGINQESEALQSAAARQAVAAAISRSEIVSTAFQGHARAAFTPFNPDWYALSAKDPAARQGKDAVMVGDDAAQEPFDPSAVELSLLVNAENPFKLETAHCVEHDLTALGFRVSLKDYTLDYYEEALELGAYDLYIGEVRLTANMDLSPLLAETGGAAFGIDTAGPAAERYRQMLAGGCELMDFVNVFAENPPFVPLCYRNAAVAYTNAMQGDFTGSDGNVFSDINTWSFK